MIRYLNSHGAEVEIHGTPILSDEDLERGDRARDPKFWSDYDAAMAVNERRDHWMRWRANYLSALRRAVDAMFGEGEG
jgi:hypothetical protein